MPLWRSSDRECGLAEITYQLRERTLTFTGPDAEARLLAHQKVGEFLATNPPLEVDAEPTHQRIIWSYWEQGWKRAPHIVKACATRLQAEATEFEVRQLTARTVPKYTQIDPVVAERTSKWKAHYSDILRVHLLAEHGGIWVDATVLTTQPLDSLYRQVLPTPFFAYTVTKFLSSWFLIAQRGSIVPVALRDFFDWFWQNHEDLPHYFWFHLCFEALYAHLPEFTAAWDSAIIHSSPNAHALQKAQLQPLNEHNYGRILRTGHVQKMTYRFKGAPDAPEGSYLARVFEDFPPVFERLPPASATAPPEPPAPRGIRRLPAAVKRRLGSGR
ncbi:Capsular polysaccharide synthesis protein [Isoptericola dokdonensis DS-3]|uniref:Capsular polysaccharide synthesis protein n=1 Tax=Isoptericola dokdonensis DS-3 TaxID=1300344 RepID=A0A168FES7_9MICO|nr:Capsular polysaccharide synthesis protein [Isoptericola dokdonensis DS-3]